MSDCRVIKSGDPEHAKQGVTFERGLSAESVGANRISMHLGTIPAGGVSAAHKHEGHETALYVFAGRAAMEYGDRLEHTIEAGPGDFLFVGADVPHRARNVSDTEPVRFVVARTDPNEEESIVLLPELE